MPDDAKWPRTARDRDSRGARGDGGSGGGARRDRDARETPWTRDEFDAAVDALCGSSLPSLDVTPAQWRSMLRDGTEASRFRNAISGAVERFVPDRRRVDASLQERDTALQLRELGGAVLAQWGRTHDPRALRMAVALWREVVTSAWLTDVLTSIGDLAARFLDAYRRDPALPLLDTAVRLGEDAVFDPPAFPQTRPRRLLVLAEAQRCRFEHTADRGALVMARMRYEEASSAPDTREAALAGLAAVHAHIAELTGVPPSLDGAAGAVPSQRPWPADELGDGGRAVPAWPDSAGAGDVTPESVWPGYAGQGGAGQGGAESASTWPGSGRPGHAGRAAGEPATPDRPTATGPPTGPLARAAELGDLAAARLERYLRAGDSACLEEAVDALRRALALTPADHRDRPLRQVRLGIALRHAYRRRPAAATAVEAVAVCRSALTAAIDRETLRTGAVVALALALVARYGADGGGPEHLAEARLLATELAHAYPPGHPRRDAALAELADVPELAEAAGVSTGPAHPAYQAHPAQPGPPSRPAPPAPPVPPAPSRLAPRGSAPAEDAPRRAHLLVEGAAFSLSHADPRTAESAYAEAARTVGAPLRVRGLATQRWAQLAAENGDFDAATEAYRLAVDLLPELVAELERRDDQEHQLQPFAGLASDAAACALNRGADPAEALDLLERGRCVLFSRALGEPPVRVDEVVRSQVAAHGPVVVVNVSRFGSHALVLTADETRVIPLYGLTPEAVQERRVALDLAQDLLRAPTAAAELRRAAGRFVTSLLGWLWDVIAGPVLDTLGLGPAPDPLPRLWWLPTGQLSLLPLHAAGHHAAADGRSTLDRVVGSYTPTLHQLLRARASVARRPPDRSLVVAIGETAGALLPAARGEAAVAATYLPNARVLLDEAADPATVRTHLATAGWVHIACHATTDVADPSANRLALTGGHLSVVDVGRMRVPDAYFAYLSACGTARGGDVLPDEVIHIASAFQLAGYPHVIGTLWPIVDDVAARIATDLYAGLAPAADPARLLHTAVRRVRDEYAGNSPLLWSSHLHTGP
ncbi:CHAT domain-containing protein [Streptomyces sp. NPDC050548]|uniref:CHAT domain-containing protein n=1 Tax=Streptomyces sp. NPDC050548 TaxID=3365629 RepID=UPI0037A4410F